MIELNEQYHKRIEVISKKFELIFGKRNNNRYNRRNLMIYMVSFSMKLKYPFFIHFPQI